jgi:pimeloyl-ACP methyl ester carboxylesterase
MAAFNEEIERHERRFNVNGRVMAARCWHDSNKPPLLALHGWLDNAATFDLLAPQLDDYYIVALDFAGHGYSSHRPKGVRYHLVDHVDDVVAVLKQLGWTKFSLMGHSMGAGIAALLAAALPEAIEKLVMIEGLGPYTGKPDDAAKHLRVALDEWQSFDDAVRVIPSFDIAVKARMNGLLPVGEQAAQLLCARGTKEVPDGLIWLTDKRLRLSSPTRFYEEQVCAFLAAIQAPTLLIMAKKTLPFNKEDYQKRVAAHQYLTRVTLEGGHHLHLDDNVEGVAMAVHQFLQAS